MKHSPTSPARGFTLIETVIAIGVLAVLLTGFMMVFAPAAAGIKQAISVQDADRLSSTLEQELVTLRSGDSETTGFEKAFNRIQKCNALAGTMPTAPLLIYQYRGKPTQMRGDGTPTPVPTITGMVAGQDYIVVPMVRQKGDIMFKTAASGDIAAIEGGLYLVKCTQLVFNGGQLTLGTPGSIKDLKGASVYPAALTYPEAVIPFAADFYSVPAKAASYVNGSNFDTFFKNAKNPIFTRNLAVRR